jgi:hypothetical protein
MKVKSEKASPRMLVFHDALRNAFHTWPRRGAPAARRLHSASGTATGCN